MMRIRICLTTICQVIDNVRREAQSKDLLMQLNYETRHANKSKSRIKN
jgi:hypothetical protein